MTFSYVSEVKAFLKSVALYLLVILGGTWLFMVAAELIGYLPYSDRPGPGWYGCRIANVMAPERTEHSHAAPDGWHTVTPRIVVDDAQQLVAFLKHVFGATGEYSATRPSELRIGDSVVMISDTGVRGAMAAFLYVYVDDADATYRRALDGGARSLEEPFDTPYGDRRAMVEDKWGNTWQIAMRL